MDLYQIANFKHWGYRWVVGELMLIGHVRYINILTWLRDFQDKLLYFVVFSLFPSLFWELWGKRNLKNLQFWPEALGSMLKCWYIKCGPLTTVAPWRLPKRYYNRPFSSTVCLFFCFISKWAREQNVSYGNDFYLHENELVGETLFQMNGSWREDSF